MQVVPNVSGVYVMRDEVGHIIYIGKAKDLKKRLSSYFVSKSHDAKVTAMLARVASFEYFITKTEHDALGLEANLIKKHKPHYNILLKDNRQFPYLRVVEGKFPHLEVTRKIVKGGKYFGPYFNGIWANELLRTIHDIFPIRECKNMGKQPCTSFQIGRCSGPCGAKVTQSEYANIVEDVKKFLRGESDCGAREILTAKMEKAAELNQFEIAIRYRDGLRFLDKLKERTITQVGRDLNCDVFGYFASAQVFAVSVLTVRAGKMIGIQNFADGNKGVQSAEEMLDGFIAQYYLENPRPEEIVTAAERGHKKQLLDMANENAKEYVETSIEKIEFKNHFTVGACEELSRELGLHSVPKKIECFDISNLQGEETVASMVVFIDGRAEKKLYRRFKIRSHEGIDDYKSMQEVIKRRMARVPDICKSTDNATLRGDWAYPDLIMIDGGKGQLSSVVDLVREVSVIAFSEQNEIFVPGRSEAIVLSKRSYALRLLQRVRDEAHRFAVAYHHKRRDIKSARQFRK